MSGSQTTSAFASTIMFGPNHVADIVVPYVGKQLILAEQS